jgi:hypothetical protein
MNKHNTVEISDEELELNAYLGEPAVVSLCEELGEKGKDIVSASWKDGFSSGAQAVEECMARSPFDATIVFTETSGAYESDLISLRATLLDGHLYLTDGFNHNEQESFDTKMLSPDSKKLVVDLVNNHNRSSKDPVVKQK